MKKRYCITNIGCDDETSAIFYLTEKEYQFLDHIFTELNKFSSYGCMPEIYIDEM